MKEIISTKNELIKTLVSLKTKTGIVSNNMILVESYKIIKELIDNNKIINIYLSKDKMDKYPDLITDKTILISPSISAKLSDTVTSSGVFATTYVPKSTNVYGGRVVILDQIQDPSNLGAIIRTARASNYNDIVLIDGVYPYGSKVIRASMGHIFGVNIHFANIDDIIKLKQTHKILGADIQGENIFESTNKFDRYAIVIGNEGNGISKELRSIIDYYYTIPMNNQVESLNASVSAGILMYNLIK